MKYCKNCKQKVEPETKNGGLLIALTVFFFLIDRLMGFVALVVYLIAKEDVCPICKANTWKEKEESWLKKPWKW